MDINCLSMMDVKLSGYLVVVYKSKWVSFEVHIRDGLRIDLY